MSRLDRRALIASGAAAALLAASGVSLEAAPRPGGALRLAVPRAPDGSIAAMQGAVFDSLTHVGPDGVLRGALATGWTGTADAREWRFDLRDGVQFHDGRPFGAADAAVSLARHGIVAQSEGRLSLRIALDRGNPDLPYLLAAPHIVMLPAEGAAQAFEQGIGTGLYRTVAWQNGRYFKGVRVQSHYRDGQAGWLDGIEIAVIPDARVRAEALRGGYVDVAELPLPDGLDKGVPYRFHPSAEDMALAAHPRVGVPARIGTRAPLDDGRIAERWWIAG